MNISSRVKKNTARGVEMLSVESSIKEMCILSGSLPVGSAHTPSQMLLPNAVASMLKEGTRTKSKEKIRDLLESRGARISFHSGELETNFTLSSLTEDFLPMLKLLKELMEEPSFPEAEWESARSRAIASTEEVKQGTNEMASVTLLRELYQSGHPHYDLHPDEAIAQFKKIKAKDLASFHKSAYAKAPFKLAFAGPQDKKIIDAILRTFENSSARKNPLPEAGDKISKKSATKDVDIKDKTSVTLALGQALSVDKLHSDYLPLLAGIKALGGDFAARLVQEVREKRGLTYGTYAGIYEEAPEVAGYFKATATFAPTLLKQGEEVVRSVIHDWHAKGLDAKELEDRKSSMRGSYIVWFSSVRNLVKSLLGILEDGREVEYIDNYLSLIEKLTLKEVNGAIKKHIDPKKMVTVRAGSIGAISRK